MCPADLGLSPPRRLLARVRGLLERGSPALSELVDLVVAEMAADVSSIYIKRPGDILELIATHGLNPAAIGLTRLRVGEGIVGLCAASARVMNLADAQNHPRFAYRPETGEEPFASFLAIPVRRAGHTVGVVTAQDRAPRLYSSEEVEELETFAMLLADPLTMAGAAGSEEGVLGTVPRTFSGARLVGGIAIGPIVLHGARLAAGRLLTDNPAAELDRLHAAAERMQRGLDELVDGQLLDGTADGAASREVIEAYRLVAADAGWLHKVEGVIRGGLTAEAAVQRVSGELHDRMRRISDPYLRERLADIEDMAGRLLAELAGSSEQAPVPPGAILLARRLGPAELLGWHGRGIAGLVIEEATPAGHAAILARALGLPALGGTRGAVAAAAPGDDAVLDADEGTLYLRPEADLAQTYVRAQEARSAQQAGLQHLRHRPSVTGDGTRVSLMLNAGLPLELDELERTGAEGIGLFRTEISMLARGTVMDVADQTALYARVLDTAADRPVQFRTLDLGSDKLLPGSELPEEANPAMGWRSLRVGLERPAIMRRQLRALLLAAAGRPLSVMFPMVATVAEFRAARALLLAEAKRVRPIPERLTIGTMLEVPALLWQLPELLAEADFVSVGSNDLLQFLFAADRGAPDLAGRYDLLSPAVFDLLEQLVRAAAAARGGVGVPVSLCGEAAGRPIEAMALVGLGFRTLSMPAAGLSGVKALLGDLDLVEFRAVLSAIRRTAGGAASLREPINVWAREHGLDV